MIYTLNSLLDTIDQDCGSVELPHLLSIDQTARTQSEKIPREYETVGIYRFKTHTMYWCKHVCVIWFKHV